MTGELKAHEVTTSVVKAPPDEVDGGTEVALKVRVSCSPACDLWGKTVRIVAPDGALAREVALVSFDGTSNETNEFVVRAPFEPGKYTWTALFPAQAEEGVLNEESSIPFSFTVKPHATVITVWDVPSSVAIGGQFGIKVGVECSSVCSLAGQKIQVCDSEGATVGTGILGEVPWSGTTALYWSELELKAPGTERRYRWTVKFPEPDFEIAHREASCTFAFATSRESESLVTIEVTDKDTRIPAQNARVLLRPRAYRGTEYVSHTDDGGVARLSVPKGNYQVYVQGDQKSALLAAVKVEGDSTIEAEIAPVERGWLTY